MLTPQLVGDGWLARRNAVAKLAAAALLTGALLLTLDPATALTAIGLQLLIAPLIGVRLGLLLRRSIPLLISATGIFLSTLVFSGHRTGEILFTIGGAAVHEDAALGAASYAIRLIAVALPGVLVFAAIDPSDLATALMVHLRAPARFAIGAMAGFRLLFLLVEEWHTLRLARRARGIDAGWNPIARLRLFGSTAFGLLVGAIRRGTRLATAMEARGFDAGGPRTIARPSTFGALDWVVVLAGAALAAASLATGRLV